MEPNKVQEVIPPPQGYAAEEPTTGPGQGNLRTVDGLNITLPPREPTDEEIEAAYLAKKPAWHADRRVIERICFRLGVRWLLAWQARGQLPTTSELTGSDPEYTGGLSTAKYLDDVRGKYP